MFRVTEVAQRRGLFQEVPGLIDGLRPRPAPVSAEETHARQEPMGEVCPDGEEYDRMAFQALADL